ncbi:MAG: hypothetical protein ACPLRX_00365 [Candidatus Saccharicenans sp.]
MLGSLTAQINSTQTALKVRVFGPHGFYGGLKAGDFELNIENKVCPVEGLLEIHGKDIVSMNGSLKNLPSLNRYYFLLFQMYDYLPELNEVLLDFFKTAYLPGDGIEVQTPAHRYDLNPAALANTTAETAARQMSDFLKKDILQGNAYYTSLVRDLRRIVQAIEGINPMSGMGDQGSAELSLMGLERLMSQYRDTLQKVESLRMIDEQKLAAFAGSLARMEGQKILYFIYQQEYRPELSQAMLNLLIANNQDNQQILSDLQDLFQVYRRELKLNLNKVAEIFSRAGIEVNFIFLERIPERFGGLVMREQSEDIYKLFYYLATATGGQVTTGNRLRPLMEKMLADTRSYYLLFFDPSATGHPAGYHGLKVTVADRSLKVIAPLGFFWTAN